MAFVYAERPQSSGAQFLFLIFAVIVLYELATYAVHAAIDEDWSASHEARRRQRNFDQCVSDYLATHGDTPGNRAVAGSVCAIHFLL